ncbi:hypothetical protein BpHYR1_004869, partial [Brachionus plicatilis]
TEWTSNTLFLYSLLLIFIFTSPEGTHSLDHSLKIMKKFIVKRALYQSENNIKSAVPKKQNPERGIRIFVAQIPPKNPLEFTFGIDGTN